MDMEQLTNAGSDYLLEIGIEELHKDSKVWMSRIELWKRELQFFQKLLDSNSPKFDNPEDKKREDHFQNLIIYYSGQLLDEYKQSVRRQEKRLAELISQDNPDQIDQAEFRNQQIELKAKVDSFDREFRKYKHDFFSFIEKVI
jgi:hypothetical protein